ncbi:hypothetical protein [uncultured Nisaea sp.]|jgi:hypothetical protein|uniref:hypothetical protein n=1 Tax=uncultured Nisaea sp. TaxID=538215 RepID=UPI0030EE3AC4|tara:strand:+ start:2212 stop:2721 length:510 start_codon:yes stop_codon:yes gene_type:complete
MADGLSRADPQKPKHMHGAAAHHDSHRDIDSDTRQEFLFLYTDASANIRFAKAQQWRTLIYFSALCVGVVAVGVWLRWGDVSLVRFLFYLVWVFSLATVGTILMLQSWQSSEAKKQAFMRAHFDELTRSALAQKSRFTSDVHRYIMLGFMLFYVEMATFAVSRMLWPHF